MKNRMCPRCGEYKPAPFTSYKKHGIYPPICDECAETTARIRSRIIATYSLPLNGEGRDG